MAARYRTRWYCTMSEPESRRLAGLDSTPLDKIRVTENVEVIHMTGSWAWWSDDTITTAIGLIDTYKGKSEAQQRADVAALDRKYNSTVSPTWKPQPQRPGPHFALDERPNKGLSKAAERLITDQYGSDNGCPVVGWKVLAQVAEVLSSETVSDAGTKVGHYAGMAIKELRVRLVDGTARKLVTASEGYCEGCYHDVFESRKACRVDLGRLTRAG